MEFTEARRLFIDSLERHEFRLYIERNDLIDKNKLYTREVNVKFVLDKIEECKKRNYHPEFSLEADDNKAHIFIKDRWYFKYSVIDGVINIISIHKEENYA